MSERFEKQVLVQKLSNIKDKKFEDLDNKGLFNHVRQFNRQKGIAGDVIEQCVLDYPANTNQEPDLIVVDNGNEIKTELKVTGMVYKPNSKKFMAKETMSITGVGVHELSQQTFDTSHFWAKIEHMLIVYYHYDSSSPVEPYDYKDFYIKGFDFYEFANEEKEVLRNDWEEVLRLVQNVINGVDSNPGSSQWRDDVKEEYIRTHGVLRNKLTYIDLAPKYPPRFRLKKQLVNMMISKCFKYDYEKLSEDFSNISEIDTKLNELTRKYKGKTIKEIADIFNINYKNKENNKLKAISERIVISMFGGKSKKINKIELFNKFGIVAKTIVVSSKGKRTEDMKFGRVHFDEIIRENIIDDETNKVRRIEFEDSEIYSNFADMELLCIIFQETPNNKGKVNLIDNKFVGFKRIVLSEEFINNYVRKAWDDTRDKIINNKLEFIYEYDENNNKIRNKSGSYRGAPNFIKSSENLVFIRGDSGDSSDKNRTEEVKGIKMIRQYYWIKGETIVSLLNN